MFLLRLRGPSKGVLANPLTDKQTHNIADDHSNVDKTTTANNQTDNKG